MHQGERRLQPRIGEVGVVRPELVGQEHALVHDRPTGHRHDVEVVDLGAELAVDRVGQHLAQDIQPALERVLVDRPAFLAGTDDHLAVHRLRGSHLRCLRQRRVVGPHVPPGQHTLTLHADDGLGDPLAPMPQLLVARQEEDGDAVLTPCRQRPTGSLDLGAQQLVRDLEQHPGPVTDQRVGADRATVLEIAEHLEPVGDDAVAAPAGDVGHEADATGVALAPTVVHHVDSADRLAEVCQVVAHEFLLRTTEAPGCQFSPG